MRKLLAVLLALVPVGWAAAACIEADFPVTLSIQEFGTAHFADFRIDFEQNHAELSGGVCLAGAGDDWTVEATTVSISGLQPGQPIGVEATDARLMIPNWIITAEWLHGDGDGFVIRGGTFQGGAVAGTLENGSFSLDSGRVTGLDVAAAGTGYRVWGASASFFGQQILLTDARVTTDTRSADPVCLLLGDEARIDLGTGAVLITHGHLRLGRMQIELDEEFRLSNETLRNLAPPLVAEFSPAAPGQARAGRGLAVWVPELAAGEGGNLEFGIAGLDPEHPLDVWGLYTYDRGGVDLTFGVTRGGGPRADFSIVRPVADWLDLTFGVNNRHYASQDHLHEGYVTLATRLPAARLRSGGTLSTAFTFTAAATSQGEAPDPVMFPRVHTAAAFGLRLPGTAAGSFALRANLENTVYGSGLSQYGLRLRPEWNVEVSGFSLGVAHDWRLTDGGSPFSTRLDRLVPINRSSVTLEWASEVGDQSRISASVVARYDWLRLASGDRSGFETLLVEAATRGVAGGWNVGAGMRLQLAGLLDPRSVSRRPAFLEGHLSGDSGDVELGVFARHTLGAAGSLEVLELHAAYPFDLPRLRLVPFLAVDIAPVLVSGGGPAVSGHGLVLAWDSCCGLFEIGYRQHRDAFTTTLTGTFLRE